MAHELLYGVLFPGVPTRSRAPLAAKDSPNRTPATVSEAVSFCCWDHTVPARENTYTDPEFFPPSSSYRAPTRI